MLTKYGHREWMIITSLSAFAAAGAIVLIVPFSEPAAIIVAVVIGLIWLALMLFFRDPYRRIPSDLGPGDMLSPADGTVSAVTSVDQHEATAGPAIIVRIFLSVLNVHVNRSPFDGEVVGLKYTRGRFLNAQTEESAEVNESNLITMKISPSATIEETMGVRQVSGMLARRIVCPLRIGDRLTRGEKFGMIKFGSTTELILPRPDNVEVHVRKGDRVRAGLTILATLAPPTQTLNPDR